MKKTIILLTVMIVCSTGFFGATKTFAQGGTIFESVCPDKNQPHCQQAKNMLENMALAAMGEEIKGDAWITAANRMLDNKIVSEAKFKQGINYDDALDFWTYYLASDYYSPGTRRTVMNRVLSDVYGRNATVGEVPKYEQRFKNRTLWYDRMFSEEVKHLNEDGQTRTEMIKRALSVAYGRPATILELNTWQPRKEYYVQLIGSLRNQLYSKEGGVELLAVVTRYIESLPKNRQATTNYNETLNNFKKNKWLYADAPR